MPSAHFLFYLTLSGVLLFLLLPSILITVYFFPNVCKKNPVNASFFSFSVLILIFFYFLFEGLFYTILGIDIPSYLYLISWILLIAFFVVSLYKKGFSLIYYFFKLNILELFTYVALCFICLIAISFDLSKSQKQIETLRISATKTFASKAEHDNYFQFINATAIIYREPFKKYYGNKKLTYEVEDREMLPGILYVVTTKLFENFSNSYGHNQTLYNSFGIALNALIVFPLFWFARRFFPNTNPLLIVSFSLFNTYTFINIYYCWFKMSGGAFLLAGLAYLMFDLSLKKSWVIAGILFGLAANMHASAALGYPLLLIWAGIKTWRSYGFLKIVVRGSLIIFTFILILSPWTIVKKIHFNDQNVLIRQNFMMRHHAKDSFGVLDSYIDFLKVTPLERQIEQRVSQLKNTLRMTELYLIGKYLFTGQFKHFIFYWNKKEFQYLIFLFLPYIFLSFFSLINFRIKKEQVARLTRPQNEGNSLFWIIILNIFLFIILTFDTMPPDFTYHNPLGLISLLLLIFAGRMLNNKQFVTAAYIFITIANISRIVIGYHIQSEYWPLFIEEHFKGF